MAIETWRTIPTKEPFEEPHNVNERDLECFLLANDEFQTPFARSGGTNVKTPRKLGALMQLRKWHS
jgi:hypothetical protein